MRFPRALGLAVVCVLIAASVAAVLSHVLIDLLGDVFLAADTYDHVDHRSRGTVVAAIVTGFGCVLAGFGAVLYGDARRGSDAGRAIVVRASRCCSLAATSAATIVLAILAVAAMEYADAARVGSAPGDVTTALGGSVALGLGIIVLVGASIGAIASMLLRTCARAYGTLVGAMRRLILAIRTFDSSAPRLADARSNRIAGRGRTVVRCAAKRGPPRSRSYA